MLDKLEAIGRTAGHAATLIFDRTAAVDPWLLGLGVALYLAAQTVRPRGWHTILRGAFPEATDLRPRDVIRAYLAGAGVNAIVPARGGDVVKLALVRRRIEGARFSTLAATFIPETLFETAFGTALVAWALAMGFIPVPTTSGELPALDVSVVSGHPILSVLVVVALALVGRRVVRALRGALCQGMAILSSPRRFVFGVAIWQALARLIRLGAMAAFMAAFGLPVTPATVVLVMAAQGGGRILPLGPASARLGGAIPAAGPGQRRPAPGDALLRLRGGDGPPGRHRRHHGLHVRRGRGDGRLGAGRRVRDPGPGVRRAVASAGDRRGAREAARARACSARGAGPRYWMSTGVPTGTRLNRSITSGTC